MRILSVYANCSLGGMATVYRTRALKNPDIQFDLIFENDRGGLNAYRDLQNVDVRIVEHGRLANYVTYILSVHGYREIRITSYPQLIKSIKLPNSTSSIYEFHSPDRGILERELNTLDGAMFDEIWAPSQWAVDLIQFLAPRNMPLRIRAMPNMVDDEFFCLDGASMSFDLHGRIPISWIGRLENTQKNYLDFLRTLKSLPDSYCGLVVFSLEHEPDRLGRFLGDAALLGVANRLRIYSNFPQRLVADFHRGVRDAGGVFYSTSLSESFGYAVYEAALCGCPVVSYDVGPMADHPVSDVEFVPVGDILDARRSILGLTSGSRGNND